MKICVFNAKGGVGRTTLALNLAGCFAKQDPRKRVLVADCDDQGSALGWAKLAAQVSDVLAFTVGRSRSRGFDIEILDMGPSLPANFVLPSADLYLCPTVLDGASFVAFLATRQLLEKQGKPCLVVANRVNPRRAEHRDNLAHPSLVGAVRVRDRACLAASYASGRTVFDMPGPHLLGAQEEISALAREINCYKGT